MPQTEEVVAVCESAFSGDKVNRQTAEVLDRLYDLGSHWGFSGYEPCQELHKALDGKSKDVDAALAEKVIRTLQAKYPTMFRPIADGVDWAQVAGLLGCEYLDCLENTPLILDTKHYGCQAKVFSLSILVDGKWEDEEARPAWGEDNSCNWDDLYSVLENCALKGYHVQVFSDYNEDMLFEWKPKGGAQ